MHREANQPPLVDDRTIDGLQRFLRPLHGLVAKSNPAGFDYRLMWGSPSADTAQPTVNFDGFQRPRMVDGNMDGLPGRDMGAFDRELAESVGDVAQELTGTEDEKTPTLPPADLTSYLNDPLKVAFRDERELAAMQMEMQEQAKARSRR